MTLKGHIMSIQGDPVPGSHIKVQLTSKRGNDLKFKSGLKLMSP